jgi:hypothetical protein
MKKIEEQQWTNIWKANYDTETLIRLFWSEQRWINYIQNLKPKMPYDIINYQEYYRIYVKEKIENSVK